jgi:hypothetical protein
MAAPHMETNEGKKGALITICYHYKYHCVGLNTSNTFHFTDTLGDTIRKMTSFN